MNRRSKQMPLPAAFAEAFGLALDDARTMRLRFETDALRRAGVGRARIARAWRGDYTAADYAEAEVWWPEWLPEAEAERAARPRMAEAVAQPAPAAAPAQAWPLKNEGASRPGCTSPLLSAA